YATGNPGLWSPSYRCHEPITQENCNSGKFDNKWSMSIFARNVDTGAAEWVYQMTPFDQWDYDGINEPVLVDMEVDGRCTRPWCTSTATASPMCWTAPTARCCVPTSTSR